jgi:glycosyltransferase involved in cell wall biosynthesis
VGPNPPPSAAPAASDVEVTGWVPDIRPYLRRTACFVAPLTSGTGIRNKILEAMAMAIPVAATPRGCEGIRVEDGENVLLGRTPGELAVAAIRLLRDQGLRKRIGEAGRRLVLHEHTWEQAADRYEALYGAVISERSPAIAPSGEPV